MKDAYYFPHDSNAKDDPKCIMLIEELGLEGYGIFWVLLELLRDQPEYRAPLIMVPAIARRYNSSAEKFKSVILRYGLFQVDDKEFFFSQSFADRMYQIDERRRIASEAGKKGMLKRWGTNNNLNNNPNKVLITSKVKEIKEKEIKENEKEGKKAEKSARSRFIIPEFDDVLSYFIEKGFQEEAENYYNYYQSNGWMVGRTKMKDWKAAAANWIKRSQTQFKPKSNGTNGSAKKSFTEAAREWVTG